jgi:serine/threonine-protein kinase
MAQLYLAAIDGPDGFTKTCVIKTMLPELSASVDFSNMFVTEAKVAAMLSHPNIVQVYDFGKIGDQYFLALEYVEGRSLHELLQAAARAQLELGPQVALAIGASLCDAMTYVQELRGSDGRPLMLVHRDLSPGNVLISTRGVVKLTDFGVVKVGSAADHTAVGVIKGKYDYMSPEQIHALPLDHRSDIFSLGIVLYEAATQRRLFRRATVAETVLAVGSAAVPPPRSFIPGFPMELERVLLKALAPAPEDRYQSFRDMAEDLENARASGNWATGSSMLASLIDALWRGPSRPAETATGKTDGGGVGFGAEARRPQSSARRSSSSALDPFTPPPAQAPAARWGRWETILGALALSLVGLITWFLIE